MYVCMYICVVYIRIYICINIFMFSVTQEELSLVVAVDYAVTKQ